MYIVKNQIHLICIKLADQQIRGFVANYACRLGKK